MRVDESIFSVLYHDTDCHYRNKDGNKVKGYSVNVTETCDQSPEKETPVQKKWRIKTEKGDYRYGSGALKFRRHPEDFTDIWYRTEDEPTGEACGIKPKR